MKFIHCFIPSISQILYGIKTYHILKKEGNFEATKNSTNRGKTSFLLEYLFKKANMEVL